MIKKIWLLTMTFIFSMTISNSFLLAKEPELDKIVAVVNEDVIMKSELEQKVDFIKKQLSTNQSINLNDDEIKNRVLNQLIDVELQLQIAKRVGLKIKDEEVNQAVDKIAEENYLTREELKSALARDGIDFFDFKKQIREQMLIHQIVQQAVGKNIVVTDEEVTEYLKEHESADIDSQEAFKKAQKALYFSKIEKAIEPWLQELRETAYIKIVED